MAEMNLPTLHCVNPNGSQLPLDLFGIHHREITIHGAFGRGQSFRRALALIPRPRVKALITARFPPRGPRGRSPTPRPVAA